MNKVELKSKVMKEFFAQLLICVIGMVLGMAFIPVELALVAGVGSLVVLIVAAIIRMRESKHLSRFICNTVVFLLGINIYPAINYYLSEIGAELVLVAFGITTVLFGSLAIYAEKSKKDFTFLGGTLFSALLGLILISVVGLFIQAELLHLLISWLGVIIFSGYVLFDISKINYYEYTVADVPSLALDLFLDFLNLFLDILRIIAILKSDD